MKDDQNKLVNIHTVKWVFTTTNNGEILLDNVATNVMADKERLTLDGLTMKYGDRIRVHCIAYSNATYDVISEQLTIKLEGNL